MNIGVAFKKIFGGGSSTASDMTTHVEDSINTSTVNNDVKKYDQFMEQKSLLDNGVTNNGLMNLSTPQISKKSPALATNVDAITSLFYNRKSQILNSGIGNQTRFFS